MILIPQAFLFYGADMIASALTEWIEFLRTDTDQATRNLGYMRALADNPVVQEKIHNSSSGFALATANVAVKRSLALYFARAWDTKKDVISLPLLRNKLQGNPLKNQVGDKFGRIRKDPSFLSVLDYRTGVLAHNIPSRPEQRRSETQQPIVDLTFNNLMRLSEETILLVGELGYLIDGKSNTYPDRIRSAERDCRLFWHVLPMLHDAENRRCPEQ